MTGSTGDVRPDQPTAGHSRRTRRTALIGGTLAVVLGVAGLAIVSARGGDDVATAPATSPDVPSATGPDAATVPPADPSATEPTASSEPPSPEILDPVPATDAPPEVPDPADRYLDRTTEIYRRAVPGGYEMVVRRSEVSYAELFGYAWRAPTGSAELCLGDHALFVGDPTRSVPPGASAWSESPVFDDHAGPGALVGGLATGPAETGFSFLLLSLRPGVSEVVAERADGTVLDRAPVVNDVAVLGLSDREVRETAEGDPGADVVIRFVSDGIGGETIGLRDPALLPFPRPDECGPGLPPRLPMPEPGEQPADPVAAEAEVRARHALLVDQSIPDDERPGDLLDDPTGVAEAVDEMRAGPFADSAAAAQYTIDRLVFTSPTEAFFEYTIDAPTGVFANRYGIARFNGEVWQITRSTLCQDLRLADARCRPTPIPEVVQPPEPPDWQELVDDWIARANLYIAADGCGPLGGC